MTTLIEETITCAVCSESIDITIIGSTNQFGYPDLDLRPPEMARSTIGMWLQECRSCGYCAANIAEEELEVSAIVLGEAFMTFRKGLDGLHDAARPFRTAAFIAAERGFHGAAFHHTLHEAWIHDDLGDDVRASAARLNAIDHIHQVHSDVTELFENDGGDAAMEVDLLRRAGEFERAKKACQLALKTECTEAIEQVLRYELELCLRRDSACHSTGEVFDQAASAR